MFKNDKCISVNANCGHRHLEAHATKKDFCYFDIFTCLPPLSAASYSAPTIIAVLLIYLITVCGYLLK